jgi:hypothetical protein
VLAAFDVKSIANVPSAVTPLSPDPALAADQVMVERRSSVTTVVFAPWVDFRCGYSDLDCG